MKLINFPEQNDVIAKNQPPYLPYPCYRFTHDPDGRLIAVWELSDEEIEMIKITKKIYHTTLTFNQKLQPQLLQVENPFEVKENL